MKQHMISATKLAALIAIGLAQDVPERILSLPPEDRYPGWPLVAGASEYDTTAVSEWMQETYTQKEYFKPYQEDYTPLLSDLEECPDEPVKGKRWNVPLYLASPFNVRTGPEGGSEASVFADSEIQGQVLATEFKGSIRLTELLDRVGTKDAHFDGGALNHAMKTVTSDLSKLQQIHLWGHGTGRIGVIDQTEVASSTVKARLPWSILRVRKNMRVDIYDLDTGGTRQFKALKIASIDRTTNGDPGGAGFNTYQGVITFSATTLSGASTLPQTFTAGHGIYLTDDYGFAPNGIDGLIGSATIAPTFLTKSRATFPELNTNRIHNNGTPTDLTHDAMRQMCDQIFFVGGELDSIRCNAGLINAYANITSNDRRYNVVKGEFPKMIGGHREGDLLFAYDKVTATLKKDPQCAARTMKFLSIKSSFFKHTTAELGFLNRGGNILFPVPSVGGGGLDYAFGARLYGALNVSCYRPGDNGTLEDRKDTTLAGD
jgi:hypothetical protein